MKLANLDPVSSAPEIDREREKASKELNEQYGKVVPINTSMKDVLPEKEENDANETAEGLLRFAEFLKQNNKQIKVKDFSALSLRMKMHKVIMAYTFLNRKIFEREQKGLHIKKRI